MNNRIHSLRIGIDGAQPLHIFIFIFMAFTGSFEIRKGVSGNRCLLSVNLEGTWISLWRQREPEGRELWVAEPISGTTNEHTIKVYGMTKTGYKFLSQKNMGNKRGLDLWNRDDKSGRQRWRIEASPEGYYHIIGVASNKYLSASADGNSVNLWDKDDNSGRQQWFKVELKSDTIEDLIERLGGKTSPYRGISYDITHKNRIKILQTPNLWGVNPSLPLPKTTGQDMLDAIYTTISKARILIDIATLNPLPDGNFLEAIVEGIQRVPATVVIRFFVGIYVPTSDIIAFNDVNIFCAKLRDRLPGRKNIYVGYSRTNFDPLLAKGMHSASWNHAKIIAVDGLEVITGGQNLWNNAYLGKAPVHDLNIHLAGEGAVHAHKFCTTLFINASKNMSDIFLSFGHVFDIDMRPVDPPTDIPLSASVISDELTVLSVANYGRGGTKDNNHTTNASASIRRWLPDYAKHTIKLSQQDLGFRLLSSLEHIYYDDDFMHALARALVRGVHVFVVISGLNARDQDNTPYDNHGITVKDTRNAFKWFLERQPNPPSNPDALLNQRLHMASLKCTSETAHPDTWQPSKDEKYVMANHAKMYIIDDEMFYIGSDNAYLGALQEFGYLVYNKEATQKFLTEYWEKISSYSFE